MGLLWLESHFASIFGNESEWNEDLSINYPESNLYQAGLGLKDWTTKTGDDEG